MNKVLITLATVILLLSANSVYACCGSSWTAQQPPAPTLDNVTPSVDLNGQPVKTSNVYNLTRSMTKDWIRPVMINEYGVYTFKAIGNKLYYQVETTDGSVYMSRY